MLWSTSYCTYKYGIRANSTISQTPLFIFAKRRTHFFAVEHHIYRARYRSRASTVGVTPLFISGTDKHSFCRTAVLLYADWPDHAFISRLFACVCFHPIYTQNFDNQPNASVPFRHPRTLFCTAVAPLSVFSAPTGTFAPWRTAV